MPDIIKYSPRNHIRVVTATSLYDGHDVAVNIIRRILQSTGAEVIHLGHNRSVQEIVECAVQEDAQAIAITSYQGGHNEFFRYMFDLLKERNAGHVRIFGGGGGVILPHEIKNLMDYGICRLYSPDDGRELGLQGMINDMLGKSDFPTGKDINVKPGDIVSCNYSAIARAISAAENFPGENEILLKEAERIASSSRAPVIGITGTGGSGKSSIVDELIRRFLHEFPEKKFAIVSVDPSKRKSGGALLGDRIRMNAIFHPNVYMRSLATRQTHLAVSRYVHDTLSIVKAAGFDLIILETSGIGQSDTEIVDHSDISMYVMTPEYGAATQLEKIDMLDFADIIAINKFDKRGAQDALRDVRKQYTRNHNLWEQNPEQHPVFGTIASQFNDPGMNHLFNKLVEIVNNKTGKSFPLPPRDILTYNEKINIIPPERVRYLSEISETVRKYNTWSSEQSEIARNLFALKISREQFICDCTPDESFLEKLDARYSELEKELAPANLQIIKEWARKRELYSNELFKYHVRNKEIEVRTYTESLSHLRIPKVCLPAFTDWGEILKWNLLENVPGEFPFTAGVFPFKREEEDPTRMFAGEGGPERTNKRFHYVSYGMKAKRLSTAYDSVTLYGEDPAIRPDIFGKIGNAGVSVCCLDDVKKLYSGFDMLDPRTSISMTINGPAPAMVAFFMNAAIDQQCELFIRKNGLYKKVTEKLKEKYTEKGLQIPSYQEELPRGNNTLGMMMIGISGDEILEPAVYEEIKKFTLSHVRGTVQADILKEDQAQNTCIFSTDFSLKMMGDIQEYFIHNSVRNFYSVSISGYHIAEAGANPISQLAFTLANGLTYVEYFLSRGMHIDSFAPNLSFFFSNGIDPEFSVIGRVARSIWAKAMKHKYGGNTRSQQLKYHIQTSGRSLHAQEIDFNDIRTTLQALYAIYDNCNSLHTNAYDEAITTPTEESVRRAMAIQMIINHELGLNKNQNPLQGSFIIEELTKLVEAAVLGEFDKITERGGVLGAMELMYQRSKIQEESMYYETLKQSGELPIMGVNTFLSSQGSPIMVPGEIIRATEKEMKYQLFMLEQLHQANAAIAPVVLNKLKETARNNGNVFEALMEAAKFCSIGQITNQLFDVGGQYRRNM